MPNVESYNVLIYPLFEMQQRLTDPVQCCCNLDYDFTYCYIHWCCTYCILYVVYLLWSFCFSENLFFFTFILPICCSSSIKFICCISWHRCTFSLRFIKKNDPCICWDRLRRPVITFLSNTHQRNKGLIIILMCRKENYFLKFNQKGQQKGEEPSPVLIIMVN